VSNTRLPFLRDEALLKPQGRELKGVLDISTPMAGNADPKGVVMYVRSQPPESGPSFEYNSTSITNRLKSMVLPTGLSGGKGDAHEQALPGANELPRQQAFCVRLVLDIAERVDCSVRVVDVSRPSALHEVLVTPPGETEVFPVLVRPDGARLSGEAEFIPGKVRQFLASARR